MALWGISDFLTIPGAPGTVDVVGTASSEFWTVSGGGLEANVPTGTTILLGTEAGEDGFATIEAYIGTDLARVGKMSAVAAGPGQTAVYCEQPISLKNDPGYAEASPDGELSNPPGRSQVIAGIATAGVTAANEAGLGGFHAGWVGIMTYVDMHGNLRTKTETFVAASGIETGHRPYPA